MERRTFIKQAAAGITFTGLAGFGFGSCTTNGRKHITILHTNDTHSHIEPLSLIIIDANQGGVARRAVLIEQMERESEYFF